MVTGTMISQSSISVTQLKSTDEELKSIYNAEHSLADFTAPSNFKSYDEVKTRLDASI